MNNIKFLLLFIFTGSLAISFAQIKAVTETGDEVILHANGTWKYTEEAKNNDSITTNTASFTKPATANFLLKSKNCAVGFWVNPKKWNFEKATDNTSEYSFSLKENNTTGAFVVTEQTGMPLNYLRKFAIENIQKAASAFKIIKEEYRYVNGLKVLLIESNATVEGVSITYVNYYYSDTASTIQFLTFAPNNIINKYKNELEVLLNGLVTIGENDSINKSLNNKDAVQSLLVANSNCKALFTGTWSYVANGKKFIDKFEGNKIVEYSSNYKYKSEYSMRWINNCSYELRLQRSNEPAAKLIKVGQPMTVEIIEIDTQKMRYQMKYGEGRFSGEMTKEK
jgi:hypothetical protein